MNHCRIAENNWSIPIGKPSCFHYCLRELHTIVFSVRKGFSRSEYFHIHKENKYKEFGSDDLNFHLHSDFYGHDFSASGFGLTPVLLSKAMLLTIAADMMGKRFRKDPFHMSCGSFPECPFMMDYGCCKCTAFLNHD